MSRDKGEPKSLVRSEVKHREVIMAELVNIVHKESFYTMCQIPKFCKVTGVT